MGGGRRQERRVQRTIVGLGPHHKFPSGDPRISTQNSLQNPQNQRAESVNRSMPLLRKLQLNKKLGTIERYIDGACFMHNIY